MYKSNIGAWRTIWRGEGLRGIFFGWTPTLVGYSLQGTGKYGCYELFKYLYGERLFPNANKTVVYLAASASAEFFADIALCPLEAVKVRMQTTLPPYARSLREGWSKAVQKEGYAGYVFFALFPPFFLTWPCPTQTGILDLPALCSGPFLLHQHLFFSQKTRTSYNNKHLEGCEVDPGRGS